MAFSFAISPITHKISTNINNKKRLQMICNLSSDPLGARTQDPNIKSVVLYQLS